MFIFQISRYTDVLSIESIQYDLGDHFIDFIIEYRQENTMKSK